MVRGDGGIGKIDCPLKLLKILTVMGVAGLPLRKKGNKPFRSGYRKELTPMVCMLFLAVFFDPSFHGDCSFPVPVLLNSSPFNY